MQSKLSKPQLVAGAAVIVMVIGLVAVVLGSSDTSPVDSQLTVTSATPTPVVKVPVAPDSPVAPVPAFTPAPAGPPAPAPVPSVAPVAPAPVALAPAPLAPARPVTPSVMTGRNCGIYGKVANNWIAGPKAGVTIDGTKSKNFQFAYSLPVGCSAIPVMIDQNAGKDGEMHVLTPKDHPKYCDGNGGTLMYVCDITVPRVGNDDDGNITARFAVLVGTKDRIHELIGKKDTLSHSEVDPDLNLNVKRLCVVDVVSNIKVVYDKKSKEDNND